MKALLSAWLPTSSACLSGSCSQSTVPRLEPFPWISTPHSVHSLPSIHTSCIANTYIVGTVTLFSFSGDSKSMFAGLIFSHICQVPASPSSFRLSPALETSRDRLLHLDWTSLGLLVPALPQLLEWLRTLDRSCLFRDSLDTLRLGRWSKDPRKKPSWLQGVAPLSRN